ncbi:hypothetical protein Naga_100009g5 [Nannochloropsis gaditana]|uniref:Uncharacterized protein n=1 Tax=Nannochloropsis gaditana TaxID=72520 RepID=W7TYN6_9STRA|nr:hypothetical protein Naga_100009g5 [Nannochloropsis gaditana]
MEEGALVGSTARSRGRPTPLVAPSSPFSVSLLSTLVVVQPAYAEAHAAVTTTIPVRARTVPIRCIIGLPQGRTAGVARVASASLHTGQLWNSTLQGRTGGRVPIRRWRRPCTFLVQLVVIRRCGREGAHFRVVKCRVRGRRTATDAVPVGSEGRVMLRYAQSIGIYAGHPLLMS